MATPEYFNIQPADPLMDRESFSQLMGHLLRWAKAENYDPSVAGFIGAIAPIYGAAQNNMSVITHVTRILTVVMTDPRFKVKMTPDTLSDLLCAPFRIKHISQRLHTSSNADTSSITLTVEEYVEGLVFHLGDMLRNSPTGRLTEEDFRYQFDPTVLALMRYVKKNGTKDLTMRTLATELFPVYKYMIEDLADLTRVVYDAYLKAVQEPAFELPQISVSEHLLNVLVAPVSTGPHGLLGFSKRYTDLRPVQDFYLSMIKTMLGQFSVAKVDWCMDNFKDLHGDTQSKDKRQVQ